jgi:arylsulfatase A-like enzyme/Tfp pilus assembly protein PilF
MRKKICLVLLLLAGAIAVWFFRGSGSDGQIRNVLLISMDTTRADYLSCYGCDRETTPNIDALAAEGIRCENVISTVPVTLPAHCSIMTGTNPPYHGVHDNVDYQLAENNITLAEILKGHGFVTGAAISCFVLDSKFNLDQGFDSYNDKFQKDFRDVSLRKGNETTQVAIKWLDEHKGNPFFYFLHYYDPHAAYEPPEPFATEYRDNLYAGEIAFTDHCIGKVIDKLKELNLYDSTLIIIVGDHGEMLGEHGERAHSYYIYESAIKVPLIFKVPGSSTAKTIESNVGIIDIAPTVCGLLGIELPYEAVGIDLSPFFRKGQPPAERPLYCESLTPTLYNANSLLGIVEGSYKYIQTTKPELYDLKKDPHESINLINVHPQRARILQDKLAHILEEQFRKGGDDSSIELDAESVKRLESLGYVSGGMTEDFSFDQSKVDPKDLLQLHLGFSAATNLMVEEMYEEAISTLKELEVLFPGYNKVYHTLGELARITGDYDGEVRYLKLALQSQPKLSQYEIYNNLGVALIGKKEFDEAADCFNEALRLKPDGPVALGNLAYILLLQGHVDESIKYSRKTIEIDPDSASGHRNLGKALVKKDDIEGAIASFRKSLEIEPGQINVMIDLGKALFLIKDYQAAIDQWRKTLEVTPDRPDVHEGIALAMMKMKRVDEAIVEYGKSLEIEPDRVRLINALGAAQADIKKYDEALATYKRSLKSESDQPAINSIIAEILWKQGKLAEAGEYYKAALKLKHDMPSAHNSLAGVYFGLGDLDKAVEHLKHALNKRPDWVDVLNNIAWMSAVYKNKDFHNPAEAVRLAQRACELTGYKDPARLDTLSVAYAAADKFAEAVETAEKAITVAEATGDKKMADDIRKHLELFKASTAYYEDI